MKAQRPRPPPMPGEHPHAEWRDHTLPYVVVAALIVLTVTLIVWLADPAPPKTITMSAGPHDSSFFVAAEQYK
ncbi:MAG TPA: C4-dicarboxylate ABC transporter substrate-binding protein, partial [Paraburkholderia sp.]|nr:C4-dicarboxylate ABC transporter substrate-binding protein [Paraburkholderia sp.]